MWKVIALFNEVRDENEEESTVVVEKEFDTYREMRELFEFYRGRIESCPNYGFKSGHEILTTVTRTAFMDSELTFDEFNSIMILAEKAHIRMMEDNYNAGWNEQNPQG